MNKLAVLFFKDADPQKVQAGMPGMWPHTIYVEGTLEFTKALMQDARFVVLTEAELNMIRQGVEAQYHSYEETLFPPPEKMVQEHLQRTMKESREWAPILIDMMGAYNMSRGLARAQIDEITTRLAPIQQAVYGGSLYLVMEKIAQLKEDELVPISMKIDFINYIREYLGLPYV